jgi:hypothetical protein
MQAKLERKLTTMKKNRMALKQAARAVAPEQPRESLKDRCARLRAEAESVNDDASATFYTAMFQAFSLRLPETLKEANLILLLNRKLAD